MNTELFLQICLHSICAAIDCKTGTIDSVYNDFVRVLKWHVNITIPIRTVAMGDQEPVYITPRIRLLLRKRNRFRRAGKVEQVDGIAVKINIIIQRNRSTTLSGAKDTDTRKLSALLRQTDNWGTSKQKLPDSDPDEINDAFTRIATDPNYSRDKVIEDSAKVGTAYKEPIAVSYTIDAIEILLSKISKTSPGFDNISYWVYRDCAGELKFVVTKIINMSIGTDWCNPCGLANCYNNASAEMFSSHGGFRP